MKTIRARITKNIKEDPSVEQCDIWNIEASFLEPLPSGAHSLTTDAVEIGVFQLAAAREDGIHAGVTIRTQRKSPLAPGDVIHIGFRSDRPC
jgi:hypothetical protein